jgi:ABC-2 type transport system ATP-binding protein
MSPSAIDVQNLIKNYGPVKAVDNISFEIKAGELVGFLGNNGAGKSTTMRVLTTYMPASSGVARVAGYDVMTQSDEVRRRLGYLPESVPLYADMRVEEYLVYRAKLKGVERSHRKRRIDESLSRCRIREVRSRLLGTLSKGYRQRVGLADTLLADPAVLILDEPLSGLDPVQQEETLASIRSLGGERTVLFSSHHLPDVEKICDRVLIINRGTLKFDGKLSDIRDRVPTVVLECKAPAEVLRSVLAALPHAATVEATALADGYARAELKAEPGHDLREAAAAAAKNYPLRSLLLKRDTLEDIYMRTSVRGE